MKILITGAKGFIGKNLVAELRNRGYTDLLEYDRCSDPDEWETYVRECEFVFHLAGVNRPEHPDEFEAGNTEFTTSLLETLRKYHNKAPVLITSSVQALIDNPYGRSKKAAEDRLLDYGAKNGIRIYIYRLPNVFGKWSRPDYNSVIATFCHRIARAWPVQVHDPGTIMNLVYIDDVVDTFIRMLKPEEKTSATGNPFEEVEPVHTVSLGAIVSLLRQFSESRNNLRIPHMSDAFTKKLYATYQSYLPEDQLSYPLKMNTDERGSFTEFLKSPDRGQVSVNISKPGVRKGNHWHHTKSEKFLVVSGQGVIRLRKVDTEKVLEYVVSGSKSEVIDIPVGYIHSIENTGETDLVTLIWVNEIFDKDKPDTYVKDV